MKFDFKLWEGHAPGYVEGWEDPYLSYYPAQNKRGNGAVVILAGGGYMTRSTHEYQGYAEYLSERGIDCFAVHYRVKPYHFPCALLDARRGLRFVRSKAEEFGIDPNKIAIMGSSAGGHLAALLSTYRGKLDGEGDELDLVDCIPNGQILCYPVIEYTGHAASYENLLGDRLEELLASVTPSLIADDRTPPAFMWHTFEDKCVNITNTYNYAKKLKELGKHTELHVYPHGNHGLGLAPDHPYIKDWANQLMRWLKLYKYIEE